MVCFNIIQSCSITVLDINNATHIFGHDIISTMDKTARKSSEPVVADYVEVPWDLKELNENMIISPDVMFVGGIGFFVIGSRGIRLTDQHVLMWTV